MTAETAPTATIEEPVGDVRTTIDFDALEAIQRRVLRLSTPIVDPASRPASTDVTVAGHQASSAPTRLATEGHDW